jgi:hypothetical protein
VDALGFHLLLGAALIYDIPTITIHAELRAQSPADFLEALTAITSWPVGEPEWRTGYRLVAAALIFAPVLLTGAKVLHRPPPRSDPQWTLLGLAGWIELQLIAAAYGRGLNALASRYLDIFLVGIRAERRVPVPSYCCLAWSPDTLPCRTVATRGFNLRQPEASPVCRATARHPSRHRCNSD